MTTIDKPIKKVVVAMSGGVDSSVAAVLLIQQGYEVTGMMLKLWTGNCDQQENACCTPEAINQARSVATKLNIPFYVIDAIDEFKQKVVDSFISDYQKGLTPNPCFVCNQTIKWGVLLDKALQFGAEYIATGHYANIERDLDGSIHLKKGKDEKKDQSYILAGLSPRQLSRTLLPLGNYHKSEVRTIAQEIMIDVADKPDSQDLCFIGKEGYRDFLEKYGNTHITSGNIRDASGNIVGKHNGLVNYTIGQRKGIGSGFSIPHYVIKKDIASNELIIGTEEELGTNIILVGSINWVQKNSIDESISYSVKIRYKSTPVECKVKLESVDTLKIVLPNSVRDATPGQIAVIYNQDEVLASGIILSSDKENNP